MFTISPGTTADYDRLAHLHPRPNRPATRARILVARARGERDPVGVLVVSLPILNAPWRSLAWPGRYSSGDRRADARRINDELRTISRVIVSPAHRARAVATALVRAYLADPLTPATESLVLRARPCRFFTDAAMTPYPLAPSPHHARLADALNARVGQASRLPSPFLTAELRTWARSSRATARLADSDRRSLLRSARAHLRPLAFAYAHTRCQGAEVSRVGHQTRAPSTP